MTVSKLFEKTTPSADTVLAAHLRFNSWQKITEEFLREPIFKISHFSKFSFKPEQILNLLNEATTYVNQQLDMLRVEKEMTKN